MTADLVPAEVLAPAPPLSDDDLERFGTWAGELATAADLPVANVAGDLDLQAGGEADPYLPEPVRRWRIDGDRTAAWAMAKLAAATDELQAAGELATEYHRQIDQWLDERSRRARATAAYMEAQLCDYGLRVREASGDSIKSVPLPHGRIKTTGSGAKATVADEPAVLAWAKSNLEGEALAEVVRVTEHVSVTNWRDHVELTTVVDQAEVVMANCGCVLTYTRGLDAFPPYQVTDDSRMDVVVARLAAIPGLGDGVQCPSCKDDTLVGNVTVQASHQVVVWSETGEEVPGAAVEPPKVTAKAVPTTSARELRP